MDYLAVDFGTANCVAAEQGLDQTIRFVALENDEIILPTALYIPSANEPLAEPSKQDFEHHFRTALKREVSAYQIRLQELDSKHKGYILNKGPKKPVAPQRSNYLREDVFLSAQIAFEREFRQYETALDTFKRHAAAEFRKNLMDSIQLPRDEDQIRAESERDLRRNFAERNFKQHFEQTFFSALKDAKYQRPYFGQEALRMYSESRLGGFLLKSPKAFLGTQMHHEHAELFELGIGFLLRHIKIQAEKKFNKEFLGIVIGRPVNFLGADDDAGNQTAIKILKQGAKNAGFAEIKFVYEPHAAALAVSRVIRETKDPAMIVDLGGGTTDCTYLKCEDGDSLTIFSSNGKRIGGSDIDEKLAWHLFSKHLGQGVILSNGRPMPTSVISDLLATRNISKQAKFRRSLDEIYDYLSKSKNDERVFRLFETHRDQLQHRLIMIAEAVKKSMSQNDVFKDNLNFYESPIYLEYHKNHLVQDVAVELVSIIDVAKNCILGTESENQPCRVFLTGGLSLSPDILSGLQLALPRGSTFSKLDPFRSVGAGLAIVARALSDAPPSLQGPTRIRGIPIMS